MWTDIFGPVQMWTDQISLDLSEFGDREEVHLVRFFFEKSCSNIWGICEFTAQPQEMNVEYLLFPVISRLVWVFFFLLSELEGRK